VAKRRVERSLKGGTDLQVVNEKETNGKTVLARLTLERDSPECGTGQWAEKNDVLGGGWGRAGQKKKRKWSLRVAGSRTELRRRKQSG